MTKSTPLGFASTWRPLIFTIRGVAPKNVAAEHPEEVARLERLAVRAREELGDSLARREGREVRKAGAVH